MARFHHPAHRKDASSKLRRIIAAEVATEFGLRISAIAFPILLLDVSSSTVAQSILHAAPYVLLVVFALPIGAAVDSKGARSMLMVIALSRGLTLAVAAVAVLRTASEPASILIVASIVGLTALAYEITQASALVEVAGRAKTFGSMGWFEGAKALGQLGGYLFGGVVVASLGAVSALGVDAAAWLLAALLGARMVRRSSNRKAVLPQSGNGLGYILLLHLRSGALRRMTLMHLWMNTFSGWCAGILVIYATNELGLEPVEIGLAMALGASAGLIVSPNAARISGAFTPRRTLRLSAALSAVAWLPLAAVTPAIGLLGMVLSLVVGGVGGALLNPLTFTIRTQIVPAGLLARSLALARILAFGAIPIGALGGGLVANALGLRWGFLVGAVGALPAMWLAWPVWDFFVGRESAGQH